MADVVFRVRVAQTHQTNPKEFPRTRKTARTLLMPSLTHPVSSTSGGWPIIRVELMVNPLRHFFGEAFDHSFIRVPEKRFYIYIHIRFVKQLVPARL